MDEDKHRHTAWLTDKTWASVQKHYKGGNCTKQNEYIERPFFHHSQKAEWSCHLHQRIQRKACQHPPLK